MRTALGFLAGSILAAAGCGWYGSLGEPARGGQPQPYVTLVLPLSGEFSGVALDLDLGLTEGYYSGPGECPSGLSNTGWDLKIELDSRVMLNPLQQASIGAAPGDRPETVDPDAVVFGPTSELVFEAELLMLVRTDLGALYALFDPQPVEQGRAIAFSFQRIGSGVCAPVCSPVRRELLTARGLQLDLDLAWIVRTDVALCGVPMDTGEHEFFFDLQFDQGQWAPVQGQIRGPGQAPGSLLVRTAEGFSFELRFSADEQGSLEWVEYSLSAGGG